MVKTGEWVSEDLGAAPPTDADFVIAVRKDTSIRAKTVPPVEEGIRRFDFTKLGLIDVGNKPPIRVRTNGTP